jgi:hypothetical protein
MTNIYCGNNAEYPLLLNGTLTLGTRHACLKKGFGRGYHMPYDANFAGSYTPIDNRKIWCGNSDITPEGYNSVGSLSQCLQKGVGCGKRALAAKGAPPLSLAFLIPIILIILFNGGLFLFLYFYKPKNVTSKGNNDIEIIDWSKFLSFYVPAACTVSLFIILMWILFTNRRRR